jgi:hypothetical protein
MRMRDRALRLVMVVSVTTMLVTPAVASEESATENHAATDDAYMIGRPNLGHSPDSVDSSEPVDGSSASPPATDSNSDRSIDVEAP